MKRRSLRMPLTMTDPVVRSIVWQRARVPVLLLLGTILYGTLGYVVLFDFGPVNALYQTVTTLTTVGFAEIEPFSTATRVFTLTLIFIGVAAVFDLIAVFGVLLADPDVRRRRRARMEAKRIDALEDHFVVCAYGRVGRAAVEELVSNGHPVVVVESLPALAGALEASGLPFVLGDSTEEAVLNEAGILRARGLVCAVDSDAANVYITLTARGMNPGLHIVARASRAESVAKLEAAGADRVVSPYTLSGHRMASLVATPAVLDLVELVQGAPGRRIEQIRIGERSSLSGTTIQEALTPFDDVMVLTVERAEGELVVPPRGDTVLSSGDLAVVVGPAEALTKLAAAAE